MSIDWFTVVAQIVNFLVLVWLLQHFLYEPITSAMERRERNIKQRLDDAAQTKKLAEEETRRLSAEHAALEARRSELLSEARAEVEALRRKLEKELREDMELRRTTWRAEIDAEKEEFIADLRERATEHFYALAREALGGLASKTLSDAMADGFADRLPDLDGAQLDKLQAAAHSSGDAAQIDSSFPLSEETRKRITAAVHGVIRPDIEVHYETSEDLICGIRMKIAGQTVAWSLGSYLDQIERKARDDFGDASVSSSRSAVS